MDTPGPEEMAGTGNESVAQLATKMTLVPARVFVCMLMNRMIRFCFFYEFEYEMTSSRITIGNTTIFGWTRVDGKREKRKQVVKTACKRRDNTTFL